MRSARASNIVGDALAAQKRRLPIAGKIRAGIKTLTRKASANGELVELYRKGLAAGASFDDIEKRLKQVQGCPQHPLTPSNSPYFRVVQSDFVASGAAQQIMNLYGEQRESDEDPQLYSFPVIFPSDDLDLIFREQFESWKSSELFRWSEPDPDSGELRCMHRTDPDPKARRKRWGGRPVEALGPCRPNACDLFAHGKCGHTGNLYFWVPGIHGVGLIELAFTSLYASRDIVEMIELVRSGLGAVKGTWRGQPIFRISKRKQRISRIDWETGKSQRVEQWLIHLSADLDMAEVLGQERIADRTGEKALPPPDLPPDPTPDPPPDSAVVSPWESEPAESAEPVEPAEPAEPAESAEPENAEPTEAPADRHDEIAQLRKLLSVCLKALVWSPDDLGEYLQGNGYSKDDMHNPEKLREVIAYLQPIAKQRMESQGEHA